MAYKLILKEQGRQHRTFINLTFAALAYVVIRFFV
jgi:hypothetical protein